MSHLQRVSFRVVHGRNLDCRRPARYAEHAIVHAEYAKLCFFGLLSIKHAVAGKNGSIAT
jgi:hypothetical protein